MKLDRLTSTTAKPSQEALERGREAVAQDFRRVEASEGVDPDRQRSLQQELRAAHADSASVLKGEAQAAATARLVVQTLGQLGAQRQGLIALRGLSTVLPRIDEQA